MRFGSISSGIEAATVVFSRFGWKAAWLSEIAAFPNEVLAHHYPDTPNHGDMTLLPDRIISGEVEAPDVLCGGTPCQAFSVAGLRGSLDDARGNLSLTFCEIANAIDSVRALRGEEPAAIVWENVPGVLSTKDNAFGCFLSGLAGDDVPMAPEPCPADGKSSRYWKWSKTSGTHALSWPVAGAVIGPKRAIAWRVLDAQYFGLAQRRRRVFVVASARNGFDPASILFEFDGVRRDSAPRRETGQVAPTIPARSSGGGGLGTDFDLDGGVITMAHGQGGAEVARERSPTLTCNHEAQIAMYHVTGALTARGGRNMGQANDDVDGHEIIPCVTHTLRGEGFDASEDGTGRGTPLVPVGVTIHGTDPTVQKVASYSELAQCLRARTPGNIDNSSTTVVLHPVSFAIQAGALRTNPASGPDGIGVQANHAYTLEARAEVQAVCFDTTQITSLANRSNPKAGDPCRPLAAGAHAPAIAFPGRMSATQCASSEELSPSLCAVNPTAVAFNMHKSGNDASSMGISEDRVDCLRAFEKSPFAVQPQAGMQVRRLTPRECERLQGFQWRCAPDLPGAWQDAAGVWWSPDYTKIPRGKKPADACADGPRYKALGNSWAVNNVVWVASRLNAALRVTPAVVDMGQVQ